MWLNNFHLNFMILYSLTVIKYFFKYHEKVPLLHQRWLCPDTGHRKEPNQESENRNSSPNSAVSHLPNLGFPFVKLHPTDMDRCEYQSVDVCFSAPLCCFESKLDHHSTMKKVTNGALQDSHVILSPIKQMLQASSVPNFGQITLPLLTTSFMYAIDSRKQRIHF